MNAKAGEHRRSEPCGLDVTISARYDWSVERQLTTLPRRHWNLRNLALQQECYLNYKHFSRSLKIFFRLHCTFARLYNAAASPALRLRSAGSLAINVGPSLSSQLPNCDNANPAKYICRAFSSSFMFRAIHDYEGYDLIIDLKSSTSTKETLVERTCIKLACNHMYQALGKVYNQSLEQGIVPDSLKLSKVTSIDKGGDISDAANFRLISTFSAFAQILEKLAYKQLINYIEKYGILCQFQFGFRKGRSTEQAMAEITDKLKKAIDT